MGSRHETTVLAAFTIGAALALTGCSPGVSQAESQIRASAEIADRMFSKAVQQGIVTGEYLEGFDEPVFQFMDGVWRSPASGWMIYALPTDGDRIRTGVVFAGTGRQPMLIGGTEDKHRYSCTVYSAVPGQPESAEHEDTDCPAELQVPNDSGYEKYTVFGGDHTIDVPPAPIYTSMSPGERS